MAKKKPDVLKKPTWHKMCAYFDGPKMKVAELSTGEDVLLRGVKYSAEILCGKCGHMIKAKGLRAASPMRDAIRELLKDWDKGVEACQNTHSSEDVVRDLHELLDSIKGSLTEAARMPGGDDRLDLSPELGMCVVPPAILEEQGEVLRLMQEANHRMPICLTTDNIHMVQLKPVSAGVAQKIMQGAASDEEKQRQIEQQAKEDAPVLQLVGGGKKDEAEEEADGGGDRPAE